MKLIIDIPEDRYKDVIEARKHHLLDSYAQAIANGIPLPKGHGRLIILSEDAVKREQCVLSFSRHLKWISEVGLSNATVAIIEADKGDKE